MDTIIKQLVALNQFSKNYVKLDTHDIYEQPANIMDKKRALEGKINRLLKMFPAVAVIGPGSAANPLWPGDCAGSTINNGKRPEFLSDRIVQIPMNYL